MKHWRLMISMAVALFIWPQVAPAQDLASSIVGVWKLTSFSTKDAATEKVGKPFGEHPSGYFFFTRGGHVAFFAVAQDRKPPASAAPTDAERAELYKTMIAALTGTYKVEGGSVMMQVDTSWNQSRLRKSAQDAKWSFCLTAGKIGPRIRRDDEQTSTPDAHAGLQGESGTCGDPRRDDLGSAGRAF